jgi:hypothetical protein
MKTGVKNQKRRIKIPRVIKPGYLPRELWDSTDLLEYEGMWWMPPKERKRYKGFHEAVSLLRQVYTTEWRKYFIGEGWEFKWRSGSLKLASGANPSAESLFRLGLLMHALEKLEENDKKKMYLKYIDNGEKTVLKYFF